MLTERRGIRRLSIGLCVAILCALGIVVLTQNSVSTAGKGKGACIQPKQHKIAKGSSDSHKEMWTVSASIRNNDGCKSWLLGLKFEPFGPSGPSWRAGWGIPTGGSIPKGFPISAEDLVGAGSRSFSGIAGTLVKEIEVTTNRGETFTVHPKRVSSALVRRYVWLKNLGYFVRYLASGDRVTYVRVRNNSGKVLYQGGGVDGIFESP